MSIKSMKRWGLWAALVVLCAAGVSAGQAGAAASSVLPKIFAGWELQGPAQVSRDPGVADPTHADLLKEYGFGDVAQATYVRPGRKLTVRVARFEDASGAYGAFTFYRTPEMAEEQIGDKAASSENRVVFLKSNLLVEARFDQVTVMSGGELRELAAALPRARGTAANLPSLQQYLPRPAMSPNSAKYVTGPVGLRTLDTPVPENLVDFSRSPEVATARYQTDEGAALLTLISYPTPQIAAERLRAVEALNAGNPPGHTWQVKRSGPLVAIVSGNISPGEGKSLLASVHYDAEVTWNENTFFSKRENLGNFLYNLIVLVGVLFGVALLLGVAFGGFRILMRRLFPGRWFDRPEGADFISLHLSDR